MDATPIDDATTRAFAALDRIDDALDRFERQLANPRNLGADRPGDPS